jgi:PAS domain S-box-containing protein
MSEFRDRYQSFFEHARDILLVIRASDGRILEANQAAEKAYGYPREELQELHIANLRAVETHALIAPQMHQAVTGGILFETIHRHKDGSSFPVEVNSLGVDNAEEPAILSIIRDISSRKLAEQALAESEDRYRRLVELSPEPIAVHSEGKLVFINTAGARLLGVERAEQLIGYPVMNLVPPEDQSAIQKRIGEISTGISVSPLDEKIVRPDGSVFDAEIISAPIIYQGKPAFQLIARNISGRIQAERALKESEEHFRTLIEKAPVAIGVARNGLTVYANPRYMQMFGYQGLMELVGHPLIDQISPQYREEIALRAQRREQGQPVVDEYDTIGLRKDGSQFPFHVAITLVELTDGPATIGFFTDITGPKRAEQELKDSEERYRKLVELSPEGIGIICDGRLVYGNQAGVALLGAERLDQLTDMPITALVTSEYNAIIVERIQKIVQGEKVPVLEHTIKRLDGSIIIAESRGIPFTYQARPACLLMSRDITDRKQAETDFKRRLLELEALHAVALAGEKAVSLDKLIDQVIDIMGAKLYPDDFGIAFIDNDKEVLRFHPSSRFKNGAFSPSTSTRQGITGTVARTGRVRRVSDTLDEPDYMSTSLANRSELCVPLLVSDQVIGVINSESCQPNKFHEADERLLNALAGELSTAIEKMRFFEAERTRRKELEILIAISSSVRAAQHSEEIFKIVLNRSTDLLGAEAGAIAMLNAHNGEVVFRLADGAWAPMKGIGMAPGMGVGEQVISTRKSYLNNDILSDLRLFKPEIVGQVNCLLCVPLIAAEQTIGLLYIGRNLPFSFAEVHLMEAIGDIAANAIHRARLNQQTGHQLEQLTALRAIDQSILSGLGLQVTLDVLLEKMTTLLSVDAADIFLFNSQSQILELTATRGLFSSDHPEILIQLGESHVGRVALARRMEFILDLNLIDDELTHAIRRYGKSFISYIAMPLISKGKLKGVVELFRHSRLEPDAEWVSLLEALADQAAIAIDNAQLFNELQRANSRLTQAYDDTIDGWSRALDLRDKETEGHSKRVTDLTLRLARRLGVQEDQLPHIRRGAQLHDIGKMGIPDNILLKPGPLSPEEWKIMCQHPLYAYDLLAHIEYLHPALDIPYCHHERWDGTGYPRGLMGEEIPLPARIFWVVDVWDALCSDRPYRQAWGRKEAIQYIQEQAGTAFDPVVVDSFLELLKELES